MDDRIRVTGLGEPYDVVVATGSLATLGKTVEPFARGSKVIVVTNDVVGPLYGEAVTASLATVGLQAITITLQDGEANKTSASLAHVYDEALGAGIERGTPIVGLGGGVITDLAGYAAATLLRGLPYIPVPTSLLAMVDASVGGKTGVNHAVGKNLIGAFYPASVVVIDPQVQQTLSPRDLHGGLAECVKHDVIRDARHLAVMEDEATAYAAGEVAKLSSLVAHNVRIKASVVAADPYEQGERAHLNLGHTFGHAFEKATNYAMSHGEAVAVGVACACRLSARLSLMTDDEADRVVAVLTACRLPTDGVRADVDAVLPLMLSDKKVRGGKVRFVLPVGLGSATVRDDVDPTLVREVVADACGGV